MGVSYRAYSIIGVYFDIDLLYRNVKRKTFEHEFSEDQKFCSETGRALWMTAKEPITEFDDYEEILGSYKIIKTHDAKEVYCALFYNMDSEYNEERKFLIIPDDLQEQKKEMKEYLEKFGLWNDEIEKTFGLHTILCC